MTQDVSNEHITRMVWCLHEYLKASRLARYEADPDDAEACEFLEFREHEIAQLADLLLPPRDCFPPNVIPLYPRSVAK